MDCSLGASPWKALQRNCPDHASLYLLAVHTALSVQVGAGHKLKTEGIRKLLSALCHSAPIHYATCRSSQRRHMVKQLISPLLGDGHDLPC